MTNYNDGNWHGWNGGECPVHPKSRVDVAGSWGITRALLARSASWYNSIIAFRVVKEHREPREFWVYEDDQCNLYASRNQIPASFKVREVLE